MKLVSLQAARLLGAPRYFTGKPCKHGHVAERRTGDSKCVECRHYSRTERYRTDPAFRADVLAKHRAIPVARRLLYAAKVRAREEGVPFDLKPEDLFVPETCPVLGIPMKRARGRCDDSSPTLDKIRPTDGYVRGNVAVISFRANTLKSNATPAELRRVAAWIEQALSLI